MAVEDEPVICEICKQGRVTKRMEEMAFRQWSDKGYIHCRATILIGTCNNCHVKQLDPGSDKILDEAFQREYDKLRSLGRRIGEDRHDRPGGQITRQRTR
jgi:hypothetical protein